MKHHRGWSLFATSSSKSGGRVRADRGLVDEFLHKEMSRREMVRNTFLGAAGAWLGGSVASSVLSGCLGGSNDGGNNPPPPTPHLVGMGYDPDHDTAMRAALAETIGLSFVNRGDVVYLRVNSNSGDPYPYSTSPDTIRLIGRMLLDLGATVIIGDRSFWGDPNTAYNLQRNGIAQAAADIGVTPIVFDTANVDWLQVSTTDAPNWVGGFRLPLPVTQANHIISLPLVKTHFIAGFTGTMKLVLGLVNPDDRARPGNLYVHDTRVLFDQVCQANVPITPSLSILDGHSALITGGPTPASGAPPTIANPGLVVASTDRIATDVTDVAILKTLSPSSEWVTQNTVWQTPMILKAVQYVANGHTNLGIYDPSQYDLSGPTVPGLDVYRNLVLAG